MAVDDDPIDGKAYAELRRAAMDFAEGPVGGYRLGRGANIVTLSPLQEALVDRIIDTRVLRRLLWTRHGCTVAGVYGGGRDGICASCALDFFNAPVADIAKKLDGFRTSAKEPGP